MNAAAYLFYFLTSAVIKEDSSSKYIIQWWKHLSTGLLLLTWSILCSYMRNQQRQCIEGNRLLCIGQSCERGGMQIQVRWKIKWKTPITFSEKTCTWFKKVEDFTTGFKTYFYVLCGNNSWDQWSPLVGIHQLQLHKWALKGCEGHSSQGPN